MWRLKKSGKLEFLLEESRLSEDFLRRRISETSRYDLSIPIPSGTSMDY
jgi:hypothetical protein